MNGFSAGRALRVRHQNGARLVRVARVAGLTPRMRRIVFAGPALAGFVSAAADDHVKLFLPVPGQVAPCLPGLGPDGPVYAQDAPRPISRDYTPRLFDAAAGELAIDFVLHGDGPATGWAARAQPGDQVGIGGPRGSFLTGDAPGSLCVLVGDETALPAIGRRIEALPRGARAIVIVEVADRAECQTFDGAGHADIHWVCRDGAPAGQPDRLMAALRAMDLPAHAPIWMAGEIGVMRLLRAHLVADRGVDRSHVRAAGYWKQGEAAMHVRLEGE